MNAYLMIGIPGSGKSTKAKEIAATENAVIVSGDDIRAQLYGSAEIQGKWVEIHDEIEAQVAASAELGKSVIIDGTYYRSSYRKDAVALLQSYGYTYIEAVICDVSLATALARNFKRSRSVPDYVIKAMHPKLKSSLASIYDEPFQRWNFVY